MGEAAGAKGWRPILPALLLAACVDGYPTEDEVQPSAYEMTNGQRAAALALLAGPAADRRQPDIRLEAGCALVLERRERWWQPSRSERHDLSGLTPRVQAGEEAARFDVVLHTHDGQERLTLLAGLPRSEALRGHLLLQLIKRDCGRPSGG